MKIKSNKVLALLCAVLIFAVPLCACGQQASSSSSGAGEASSSSAALQSTGPALFTLDDYPLVDGSTANLPLMAEVMSRTCGISLEDAQNRVATSKTAESWRRLANGQADLLLVYEAPDSVKEELGDAYDMLEVTPLGRDGLVFLVNKDNPVDSLSADQLRDIYTGRTTNWKDLGGTDAEIIAYQRDADSGSQTLFLKLLMKDETPMEAPGDLAPGVMSELIDVLAEYDAAGPAIGYSVYYYASEMYDNPDLKLLAVDGVAPTDETLADGGYPLTNNFYVVIRKDEPEDSPARQLYEWILSDEGTAALKSAGYVSAGVSQSISEEDALALLQAELSDQISEGMALVSNGESDIDGRHCWTFSLGSDTSEKFTAEEHYAVTDTGEIFVLDAIAGVYRPVR